MYVDKKKFETNSSLEYYRMTWRGQTKHTVLKAKEVFWQ